MMASELELLREVARQLSIFATHVSGGGSEMFTRVGDEFYADAKLCRERYDARRESVERLIEARSAKRIEALENALRPFAEYAREQFAKWIPPEVAKDDHTPVWGDSYNQERSIYIGDLRRAAKALEAK